MKKMEFFDKSDLKFIGWNIVIAIVVGIGILVALIAYLRRYTEHGVEVDVIDVRGLVVAEANPLLADQGLHLVVVDSTYSDKVPFGTIVEQDPKPMSHAKHAMIHELTHGLDKTNAFNLTNGEWSSKGGGKFVVKKENKGFDKKLTSAYKHFKSHYGSSDTKAIGRYALKSKNEFFAEAVASHLTGTQNKYTTFAYNLAKSMSGK